MKVVNLFAGPGAGKSTTRAGLFYLMKQAGLNVEETTEYAKDLTWDNNTSILSDQLYILAKQNRKLQRIKNKVDFALTDAPLLLNLHYTPLEYLPLNYRHMVFELWDTYDNLNFLIRRVKRYNPIGRNQTEDQARVIDIKIQELLDHNKIKYAEIVGDSTAPEKIFSCIKELL